MINYDFDVNKILQQYLPIVLRKPKMLAWLHSLFATIDSLKSFFLSFVGEARKEVMQNGQVIRLENLLNNLFDNVLRRIRITDTSNAAFVLSNANTIIVSDSQAVSIADQVDFNFTTDFVVKIFGGGANTILVLSNLNFAVLSNSSSMVIGNPSSNPLVNQIENIVRRYKIAGKTFQIDSL